VKATLNRGVLKTDNFLKRDDTFLIAAGVAGQKLSRATMGPPYALAWGALE